eukprot:TRINITY_DN32410_c0_g1_i1.p1 TRINITY_DN32410_c0_g1~~TRINITY_DN32410_c0_g1_i1.p1  ORF type:complete len:422 (-),score=47.05 TRINITY_DN32410_c0_g1_i1:256-1521(-)
MRNRSFRKAWRVAVVATWATGAGLGASHSIACAFVNRIRSVRLLPPQREALPVPDGREPPRVPATWLGGHMSSEAASISNTSRDFSSELRSSHQRIREIHERIASLRANIVRQRREIESLMQELMQLEVSISDEVAAKANDGFFSRLFRSVLLLIQRAAQKGDPLSFVYNQTGTALRVAGKTAASGELLRDVLPNARTLLTYAPGIYAHATQLDAHLQRILPVLDGYLPLVEPHLEVLIERFDDIEPHLDFCLDNADIVAPHVGEIVAYLDDILFFANNRELWQKLEPHIANLLSRIDMLGPHLPALRRNADYVVPHLPKLAPYADRLATHPAISEHADSLAHNLGWLLRLPAFHHILGVPGVPRMLAWLGPRLSCVAASSAPFGSSTHKEPIEGRPQAASLAPAIFQILLALRTAQPNSD